MKIASCSVANGRFARAAAGRWIILAASFAASCASGEGASGTGGAGASTGSGGAAGSSGGSGGKSTGTGGSTGIGAMGGGGAGTTGGGGGAGGVAVSGTAGGGAGAGAGGSSAGTTGTAGSGGSGGTAGVGGRGGIGGTTGGGGRGGTGGAGGTTGGGGRGGASGAGGGASGPFVCNQVTGGKLTEEWFAAGFETVVDNSRWQVKWREDAYVEQWADPQSSFWTAQVDSACASNTNAPDRLVFGTVSFKYKTQADWTTNITLAINNFKAKWPTIRRIDLVTQIRGPNNMLCPTAPTAGETIAVPPEQDAAMTAVAAAFPGFVFVAPKVEAHSCSEFQGGGPHLTAAGNMANMPVLGDYFVQAQ